MEDTDKDENTTAEPHIIESRAKFQQELDNLAADPGIAKDFSGPLQKLRTKLAKHEKELANKLHVKEQEKRQYIEQSREHVEVVIESLKQAYCEQMLHPEQHEQDEQEIEAVRSKKTE